MDRENFSILVFDHRELAGDPLLFIDAVRGGQQHVPTFLLSEKLDLQTIIRAIRAGVKDMFHPPLDLRTIAERVRTVLADENGVFSDLPPERWSELVHAMVETPELRSESKAADAHRAGSDREDDRLTFVVAERDRVAEEMSVLRARALENEQACAHLEAELVRLSAERNKREQAESHDKERRAAGDEALAREREKFEMDQQVLAQARKRFEATRAEAAREQENKAAELARREEVLAQREQQLREAAEVSTVPSTSGETTAVRENIQADQAALKQARSEWEIEREEDRRQREQVQASLDARERELVRREREQADASERSRSEQVSLEAGRAELAAAQARLSAAEKTQAASCAKWEERQAKLEAERAELDRLRAKLQNQQRDLAESEAALQESERRTREQADHVKKAQDRLARDQATHAVEKVSLEQEAAALVEKVRLFEARQKQSGTQPKPH